MKRPIKQIIAIAISAFVITSCKTIQVGKFTSVENVINLKQNATFEEVEKTLGSKPYNVLSSQIEGYTIYNYKYKLIERKINPSLVNKIGNEVAGKEVYNGKEQTLFLFFKGGKLESFLTTDGRKDSPKLVMLNNTIYSMTKDRDKYILIPTSTEESSSGTSPLSRRKK
jgi:hypothetical protein